MFTVLKNYEGGVALVPLAALLPYRGPDSLATITPYHAILMSSERDPRIQQPPSIMILIRADRVEVILVLDHTVMRSMAIEHN